MEINSQIALDAGDIDLGSSLITNKENVGEDENVLDMKVTATHSWASINTTYNAASGNGTDLSSIEQIKLPQDQEKESKKKINWNIHSHRWILICFSPWAWLLYCHHH